MNFHSLVLYDRLKLSDFLKFLEQFYKLHTNTVSMKTNL